MHHLLEPISAQLQDLEIEEEKTPSIRAQSAIYRQRPYCACPLSVHLITLTPLAAALSLPRSHPHTVTAMSSYGEH